MDCPICGSDNPAGAETCTRCGFNLDPSQSFWPTSHEGRTEAVDPSSAPSSPVDPVPPVRPVTPPAEEFRPRKDSALLRALEGDQPEAVKLKVVEQMGRLGNSSPQLAQALIRAAEHDRSIKVRFQAIQALRSPAHLHVLRENPDLRAAADGVILTMAGPLAQDIPRPGLEGERHKRRKPLSMGTNLVAVLLAAGGLIFSIVWFIPRVAEGASWWMAWLIAAVALFFTLKYLYEGIWPKSSSSLFRSEHSRMEAEVVGRRVKVSRNQDDTRSRSYYMTVQFDAGERSLLLEARVTRRIYEGYETGTTMELRYATRDPRVALLEGE